MLRRLGVIVGIAIAILAVTLLRHPPTPELRLTQITFDPGVSTSPAISADGRMVAYVSDRESGSNADLYVQALPSGIPTRLTTVDDQSDPAFSPDGATLAFTSSKDGGGIYTVAAGGGEPKLLTPRGRTPHYSPDGHWIVFSKDGVANLLQAAGGTPREFNPDFTMVRSPVWSPDSHSLIFWGHQRQLRDELWVATLAGDAPQSTGIDERLSKAALGPGPFDDVVWTASGLLFSVRTGFVRNLYQCPMDGHGKASGAIVRLTNGTELMGDPAATPDGRIVFTSSRQRFDVWAVPADTNHGRVTGSPFRLTDTLAPSTNPDLSADGSKLLFSSSRNGYTQVWERDLVTGKEWVAATGPEGASYGRFAGDSDSILYVRPAGSHQDAYLGSRELGAGTRGWYGDVHSGVILMGEINIDKFDLKTGNRARLLDHGDMKSLSQASFSPDGRWVLFLARSPRVARVYVAPASGGDWLPVTAEIVRANHPRFSPDGRLIYFMAEGPAKAAIQAVPFEPKTGASGKPITVFESPGLRLSLQVNPEAQEIVLTRDRLVTIFADMTTNLWVAEPVPNGH